MTGNDDGRRPDELVVIIACRQIVRGQHSRDTGQRPPGDLLRPAEGSERDRGRHIVVLAPVAEERQLRIDERYYAAWGDGLSCFVDLFLLRRASANPVRPIPNRPSVAGSGTDVGVPPVPAIWFTVRL